MTEASQARRLLACELVRNCPPGIGQEIAITGSVARGHADSASDIEINIWVDEIAPAPEREAWLRAAGVENLELWSEPSEDGSIWATGRFRQVPIEVGWQTQTALEDFLQPLLMAESTDSQRCVLAAALVDAVPLRTSGFLHEWQQRLACYPAPVQRRIITSAVFPWKYPFEHATLAQRGERLALMERQIRELHRLLRALFALNGQWEPDWKWAAALASRLEVKPERLIPTVDAVLSASDSIAGVRMMLGLIGDTLDLLPSCFELGEAKASVERALRSTST